VVLSAPVPFLKASLLEFISAMMLPSVDALHFSATVLRVEGGTCSVKSELLDQGRGSATMTRFEPSFVDWNALEVRKAPGAGKGSR